ncbi:MAG TPA: sigma-54 dependent transcriptional regulator [Accumulibacter sp.]|nr:sigma-54 dependent transcriptional regulator [Accumulibacter sp.]HMW19207.1 sigma-54 dependent transcriptional regulator [Accumulibacter sp.]HMX22576.1 sigma-54 dependent transcriptional regulator [Accumulibacter sp.]HMY07561.1 sigma-54 dependent transcriptional regulator [Accumulibacter sp.]HNC16478.1 sigma-54 dependent transcriptional regulator [Accumulibacter sp.]
MTQNLPILVVEDDAALREAVCDTLELAGQTVIAAGGGEDALQLLERQAVSLVISDVRMLPMDGIALLKAIRHRLPALPVVLMTAFADVDRAVEAMRAGACDFLLKPFEPAALLGHVMRYRLPEALSDQGVISHDPLSANLFALAGRVAQTDTTVLLTGESGVGKEVVARYIHQHSARHHGPFVAINCAAIPDTLLEATLFGYEKGAFSGAVQAQAGKFEQAQNGTLLLDEVTEMPLSLQAKLLRVLQEREVERVGGKKPVSLDIRIIATSNREMAEAVSKGMFREDLYYRLNVFPLQIPALRERCQDVVPLARHFLAQHGGLAGRPGLRLSPAAEEALQQHHWPGNVRELENVIQRAIILAAGEEIDGEALRLPPVAAVVTGRPTIDTPIVSVQPSSPPPSPSPSPRKTDDIREVERTHILGTLAAAGGSRKLAGERLGMSERTLRHKLRQYRLEGFLTE